MKWNNERTSGTFPAPRLAIILGERVEELTCGSIPGIVRVLATEDTKNGKWSYSTFTLRFAAGVRLVEYRSGELRELSPESGDVVASRKVLDVLDWNETGSFGGEDVIRLVAPKTSERLDANRLPV